ncbi:Uncharacterised protein [Mycobacteroides abscessus subsp. abscessus]|nr:Uncharacterised protein [Mycobacteroides abscessus subsp. abscessus]
MEERPRGACGLPLLLEEPDDIRALHRHDAVVVGEREDRVEFGGGDLAALLGVVDVIAREVRAQTAGVRDAEVRGRELGIPDAVLERIGDEVAERALGTAVLRTVLEGARDVLGDRARDDGSRSLGLLVGVGDDLLDLVDDRGRIVLVLGGEELRGRGRPVAVAQGFELELTDDRSVVAGLDDRARALGIARHRGVEGRRQMGVAGEHRVDRWVGLGDELLELGVRGLCRLEALRRRGAEVGLDDRHVRLLLLRQRLEFVGDPVDRVGRVAEVDVGDAVG